MTCLVPAENVAQFSIKLNKSVTGILKIEGVSEGVTRERDSWRASGLPWFELQGHTVDAKPLTSRPRSIRKHMAEVSFTLLADNLCASCSQ